MMIIKHIQYLYQRKKFINEAFEMLNNLEAQTPVAPVETTVNTDELMSMQTKMEIAQAITKAGFNARDMIVELAREIGTDVPLLKESDKEFRTIN